MARRRRAARLLALPLLNAHAHTSASAAYAMRSFAPNYAPHSVAENALAGAHRTEWDVNGAGDLALQGFAREQSYEAGGPAAEFAVRASGASGVSRWRADVYRLGWYAGAGARRVASLEPAAAGRAAAAAQPECVLVEAEALLYDCANWATALEWHVPASAASGLYFLRLVRDAAPGEAAAAWRADDVGRNAAGALPQFAKAGAPAGADPRPVNGTHSYGASGHGALRDALREPLASHVWFVVRAAQGGAERAAQRKTNGVLVMSSDTTWQAYNRFGGSGLYGGVGVSHGSDTYGGGGLDAADPARRAFKVSYNRPLVTRDYRAINMPLGAELPGIMWLERNGYDVEYVSAKDVDAGGAALLGRYRAFMSLGHDEYATGAQVDALHAARGEHGTSLLFWSANEYFWRVRWEDDPRGGSRRVMVCYKDTQADVKLDPMESEWTGTFRDARPQNPLGARPENALSGVIFTVNAWRNDAMEVPAPMAALRFWRGSGLAERAAAPQAAAPAAGLTAEAAAETVAAADAAGAADTEERAKGGAAPRSAFLPRGTLGHEWDEDIPNGHRPPCMAHLSRTAVDGVLYIQDNGAIYSSGSGVHRMVAFRHPVSGALTWGTGTVQWSWALEALHDGGGEAGVPPERANPFGTRVRPDRLGVDRAAQQLSANMLRDAGLVAATLQPELVPPEPPADATAPESAVVAAAAGAVVVRAADRGGGAVAGVELSWDGGSSWHFAERAEAVERETAGNEAVLAPLRAARAGGGGGELWVLLPGAAGARWPEKGAELLVRAVDDSLNCEAAHGARAGSPAGGGFDEL